jgi:phosphoglycerate kinase
MIALDIGPQTIELFFNEIRAARTIVWNESMGVFKIETFAKGPKQIADAVAHNGAAVSIIGGGASLEFLEGKKLPGVETLSNK